MKLSKLTIGMIIVLLIASIYFYIFATSYHGVASRDTSVNPTTAPTTSNALSLEDAYNKISIGDSHGRVLEIMGRTPDLTYKATDGSNATILQYKDADVNVVRFMLSSDTVFEVTYVPADGGLNALQIKQ